MNEDTGTRVLRIGILGASRIAPTAICIPALALGHKISAIGSKDAKRAKIFASHWGVETAFGSYEEVIDSPDVDLIYNSLPNSHHAKWNIAALKAGKNVLSEKPFASNFLEAQLVQKTADTSAGKIMEGLHYIYSPVLKRVFEIVQSGEIGEIREVFSSLTLPAPIASDIRWQLKLAGGAMMDLGCYTLHVQRQLCLFLFGKEPQLILAKAKERSTEVDERMYVELKYSNGARGISFCDMDAKVFESPLKVVGTRGEVLIRSFVIPGIDDSVVVRADGLTRLENVGRISSYIWQLQAFTDMIFLGKQIVTGIHDSVINCEFIDSVYTLAGLHPRPSAFSSN